VVVGEEESAGVLCTAERGWKPSGSRISSCEGEGEGHLLGRGVGFRLGIGVGWWFTLRRGAEWARSLSERWCSIAWRSSSGGGASEGQWVGGETDGGVVGCVMLGILIVVWMWILWSCGFLGALWFLDSDGWSKLTGF
jgi:hypothetical protein